MKSFQECSLLKRHFKQSDTSTLSDINIEPCSKHYFTVTINNLTSKEIELPVGVIAQVIQASAEDVQLFHNAAKDTATVPYEEWIDAIQRRNLDILTQQPSQPKQPLRPFLLDDAQQEMKTAIGPHAFGALVPFIHSKPILDDDQDIAPLNHQKLDPHSKEYQDMVIESLCIKNNDNLTPEQQQDLETLVRKYAHVFMLPGAPFRGVTTPEHSIDTGDAPPQYQPPYAQSPSQLQIMKAEIQKMLEQEILEHSSSPWSAPCLLVKKKPENGLPVPPRLV